jgi:hypothetical protein
MPLDKRFVSSRITQLSNGQAWELRITYSYYGLYNYDITHVYASLEEAKNKLIIERTAGHVVILDKDRREVSITPRER